MLKTAFAPHLNRHVKFGRKAPRIPHTKLRASKLIDLAQLEVPDTTNFRNGPGQPVLRNVYGNDELGDCVPAWLAHFLGLVTGAAGNAYIATLEQVVAMYSAIGGYVPGKPETDQGCDEDTAISFVEQTGWPNGTKALGAIAVDATNPKEIHAVNWLFEGTMFGVCLPAEWISPFPTSDGAIWDVAGPAVPDNGHCFGGVDNDPRGLLIDSWGLFLLITFAAIAKYAVSSAGGQLFAILTPDQVAKGMIKAPNGVDWGTIVASFNARGGHVPMPQPPAPPAPQPVTPGGPITLAGAQQLVEHGICGAPSFGPFVTKDAATAAANASLAHGWPK